MVEDFDVSKLDWDSIPHTKSIGIRYSAHGADWAEFNFDYNNGLLMVKQTGVLASGPIISLIDTACSAAIVARSRHLFPIATLDLRIDYMRAAKRGLAIVARARCYRLSRSVAFVRCDAHDGDPEDLVAHASGAFILTVAK